MSGMDGACASVADQGGNGGVPAPVRVALLMNFIAPYRVPLLEALRDQVGELRAFISTPMERDRHWAVNWGSLDVTVQKNLTVRRPYRDSLGFGRDLEIHFPYDTLPQLARYDPDVVISGELGMRSLQAALYRAVRPRTRLVIWGTLSEHSEREWGKARQVLRRLILGRADGVLVNGESGARYIRSFGIPDDKVHRVNQPVDVELFKAASRPDRGASATRLLHVGTMTGRKGVLEFTRHLARWAADHPARPLELWWLGDGDLRPAVEALWCPPNLVQRFCGAVPYSDLPGFYAQADILCFPTLLDEWGLVVNEAMAAGLPVMGSIYGQAVEELVQDNVNGWVFDPLSDASTLGAIDRALAMSAPDMEAMRDAARRRVATLTPAVSAGIIAGAVRRLADEAKRDPRRARPAAIRRDRHVGSLDRA